MTESIAALVALLIVYTLAFGLPVFVLARNLDVDRAWWALVPLGETVTLGRCGLRERGWLRGLMPIALLVLLACVAAIAVATGESLAASAIEVGLMLAVVVAYVWLWQDVCDGTGQSRWWVALMLVPVAGLAAMWAVAVRANRWSDFEPAVIGG